MARAPSSDAPKDTIPNTTKLTAPSPAGDGTSPHPRLPSSLPSIASLPATRTAPSNHTNHTPSLPKPIQQSSPDLNNRPDSAYGGSGGTPSLSSADSVEVVDKYNYDIPPNPLLEPPRQPQCKSQSHSQSQSEAHHQTRPGSQSGKTQEQQKEEQSDGRPTLQQFQEELQDEAPNLQQHVDSNIVNDPSIVDDQLSSYADSAYDDASSLNESITDTLDSAYSRFRWENGRRYHSYRDGAYWGPNDETHNDQQDIAHHAWRLALDNKLYLAPIHKPERILDVGTGTGIWAIEMADSFPDTQVVGTDLSPTQPNWVPPNCVFEVDDVTMEWTYRKDSFDFIHSREMFGSIADWDEYFKQCYLHLKPGGWVEALER
ncbi:MAG: hypothetical protein Q9174_006408, partial [Haloplaca sp. 1 TL-2023]